MPFHLFRLSLPISIVQKVRLNLSFVQVGSTIDSYQEIVGIGSRPELVLRRLLFISTKCMFFNEIKLQG